MVSTGQASRVSKPLYVRTAGIGNKEALLQWVSTGLFRVVQQFRSAEPLPVMTRFMKLCRVPGVIRDGKTNVRTLAGQGIDDRFRIATGCNRQTVPGILVRHPSITG